MVRVFSATEAQERMSSMVAIRRGMFDSSSIVVATVPPSHVEFTSKSLGVLKLSGEMALRTALAVFLFE